MPVNYRFDPLTHYTADAKSGCWNWNGSKNGEGYGQIRRQNLRTPAHRHFYIHHRGAIPDGLVIDHLCRNRLCVNPEHLEVVTQRENKLRGVGFVADLYKRESCLNGHTNWIYAMRDGYMRRCCRTCKNLRSQKYKQAARLSAQTQKDTQ